MHPLFKCLSVNQHQGDQGAFFIGSDLATVSPSQTILSLQCACKVSFLCFSTAKLLLPMAHYFILSSACHPLLWEDGGGEGGREGRETTQMLQLLARE